VIGGLSSSLVLTLLLIPIMYLRFAPEDRKDEKLVHKPAPVPESPLRV
jgi:hypothetical protein